MIRTISTRPVGASTVGAVEHYRALADRLRLSQSASAIQTIGLTSCSPREGVSTVAANLAITAAAMFDRPVLLVDANFLRPALRRMFRLRQGPGLADVLLSAVTPTEVISALPDPNLSLLCAGSAVACTRAGFDPARIAATFTALKRDFGLIVVDLPAATPTSMCWSLAGAMDGTLLVVEADRVDAQQAQQAKRELVNFGAMPLGVVFNKQRRGPLAWFGRR